MKRLSWLAGLLAFVWAGLWILGASIVERGVAAWLSQREAAGWVVHYQDLSTSGFPLRFETRLDAIDLADPATGVSVQMPAFLFRQPIWQPTAIRAIWPAEHLLRTTDERLTIHSDQLEALLHVRPQSNLPLVRADTRMQAVTIESDLGWSSAVLSAVLTFAAQEAQEGEVPLYDLDFEAQGVTPAAQVRALLDPAGVLPVSIGHVRIEAVTGFDRAWDITALERARPAVRRIELADLTADWGDMALRMSGDLDVDTNGIPTGDLHVRAQNWRRMVTLAASSGALPGALRGTLETSLGLLAGLSGRPEDLDATLTFEGGQVYFGPIPLGPAPQLLLR